MYVRGRRWVGKGGEREVMDWEGRGRRWIGKGEGEGGDGLGREGRGRRWGGKGGKREEMGWEGR